MVLPHAARRRTAAAALRATLQRCAAAYSTAGEQAGSSIDGGGGEGAVAYPMLLRDFIRQSLYHPELGYFCRASAAPPVAALPEPIRFGSLVGQAEYRLKLQQVYRQLQVDWLTPAELFRPWFGRCVAKYILEERRHTWHSREPLLIVEVGGGTGSLATSILDYLSEVDPVVYSSATYACLEISDRLRALQRAAAGAAGHAGAFLSVAADGAGGAAWRALERALPPQHAAGGHCFVVMTEVLDNLPHDRVARARGGGGGGGRGEGGKGEWMETWVARPAAAAGGGGGGGGSSGGGAAASQRQEQRQRQQPGRQPAAAEGAPPWVEVLRPASDPLVLRCMDAVLGDAARSGVGGLPAASGHSWLRRLMDAALGAAGAADAAFLPTAALSLFDALHASRPRHTLVAADFDALPDVRIPGANAPLVSGRSAPGVPLDYDTIYVPWGSADIFFPTDFEALGRLYAMSAADAAAARRAGGDGGGGEGSGASGGGGGAAWRHLPTAEFVQGLGLSRHTQTLSGWNPLMQDWPNTRFFLASSGAPAAGGAGVGARR